MPRVFTLRYPPPSAPAWTPASLPNLVAWYDASDAATITASAGRVSTWTNKANPGTFDLVQATGGNQPLTGSHTMNGLNTIFIQATGRYDRMAPSSNPLTGATACSVLFVAKRTANADTEWASAVNGPGGGQDSWYPYSDGNRYEYFGTSVRKSWANASTLTNAHSTVITSAPGAYTCYYNNGSVFTTATNTVSVSSNLIVGFNGAGNRSLGGDISEIAICATNIGSGDRAGWASYIPRWGL